MTRKQTVKIIECSIDGTTIRVGEMPLSWSSTTVFRDHKTGIEMSRGGGPWGETHKNVLVILFKTMYLRYEHAYLPSEYGRSGPQGPCSVKLARSMLQKAIGQMTPSDICRLLGAVRLASLRQGIKEGTEKNQETLRKALGLS